MNSSSDLSTNNHSSSASTIVPSQGTSETASEKTPQDVLAILQSHNDDYSKKIAKVNKTLLDSGKKILELRGKMKELDEKFTESEKRFQETFNKKTQEFQTTLDNKITDQQTQIIALCGIFVAIIAFVTNNVTIFTKADNLYQALVFMVIFFILTAGIILISHQLLRQANNQVDNKDVIGMLILITVIAIFLIIFAQNLDRTKLRSHKT
jgi:hypothetical protein